MDRLVSGEQDFEVDIEAGLAQVSTSYNASEKIADDVNSPLMGDEENQTETNSQSIDVSEKKRDVVKFKKPRKASKPPRPPKRPSLTASDHKVMREIAELAMRKRERIERMKKSLRRIKEAKSSSSSSFSCISIFSMLVTVLFLGILVFQGFFDGNSNLRSDISPAPIVSPNNNHLVSVQLYNDPSPSTSYSFRYTRKRITGGEEGEGSRDVTR